jgi:hypothetical protein
MFGDEAIIEFAKFEREAHQRIIARHAAEQLGEDFSGLDNRRAAPRPGNDRRMAA